MAGKKEEIIPAHGERVTESSTASGIPIKPVYTADDVAAIACGSEPLPGQYPYTRGTHPGMYRDRLWNIQQVTGLGTPAIHNQRHRFLVSQGVNSLHWLVDMPATYGIEPDHPAAEGQTGVNGLPLHTLRDVETLCEGIPLDKVMITVSAVLPIFMQSAVLVARRQGLDPGKLRMNGGGLAYFYPSCYEGLAHTLYLNGEFSTLGRWTNDFCEYMLRNMPRSNLWFFCGGTVSDAGANAVQQIALMLACRNELIREMLKRGVSIDVIGRAMIANVGITHDFFESICTLRAARKVWARTMKEDFGATDERAICPKHHAIVVARSSNFTRQQPLVNIVRGSYGALAGVLGGCMGLNIPCYDEGWCIPTEEAQRMAIRTQQVIRYESGVATVADPLAGSYYVESLTEKLEHEIEETLNKIEQMGGWIAALSIGWVQDELKKNFLATQRQIESGEKAIVGVNRFTIPPEDDFQPKLFVPDPAAIERYVADFVEFKKRRDQSRVKQALGDLRAVAEHKDKSLMSPVFAALESDVTFPEIVGVLRMADGLSFDPAGERQCPC